MTSRKILLGAVLAVVAMVVPSTAAAQIILVEPGSWDFGGVEIGSSEPMSFLVSNGDDEPLTVDSVLVVDDFSGSFQITDMSHLLPVDLLAGESMEVVVTFAPTVEAMVSASILVLSNCHTNPAYYVPLQGMGVHDEPTPDEMMDAIMAFYEDAVADGTIYGLGNGNAPAAHLRIFLGMLDAADDLIVAGDYGAACDQLDLADGKSDGLSSPPDFIGGPGVSALNTMLGIVMVALGCN